MRTLPLGRTAVKAGCAERRKHHRLSLRLPVFLRGRDENGKEFLEFTNVLNISAGGALVAVRRSVVPSTILSIEIPVAPLPTRAPSGQAVGWLKAKLVRVTHGDELHLLGMKFLGRPFGE